MIPEDWKRTRVKVLFKKGDPQDIENYRPISIIPILYKICSKLLYGRLSAILCPHQNSDQAGFRPNFSAVDHLYTFVVLESKAAEWNQILWVAFVDFEQAFDAVKTCCALEGIRWLGSWA